MRILKSVMCACLVFGLVMPTLSLAQDQTGGDFPFETDLAKVALGESRTHQSLTIYPLLASRAETNFGFLSLDRAMRANKLSVKEWGSGSVPKLKVKNNAGKKTFIMAGEIVTGAKQDRMSAHDVLLKEKSQVVALPVYCVEQSRWVMNSQAFSSGQTAGTKTLRKSAVQKKSQGKIWSDVAEKSRKSGVQSSTGTMQAVYSSAKVKRQIERYQNAFADMPVQNPDMIGFVAVIGGGVSSADVFGDKEILNGVWKKLLKAIAVDAVTEEREKEKDPSKEEVQAFLKTGFFGTYKKIDNPGLGTEYAIERASGVAGSTLVYNNKVVHMALFSPDKDEKPRELRSNTPRIQINDSNRGSSYNERPSKNDDDPSESVSQTQQVELPRPSSKPKSNEKAVQKKAKYYKKESLQQSFK